ncbi:hypothetical protein L798_04857 [Zootermopsis nevadensis]|uniref:Uncharacterized protein n=2 Tax=Zootermopsis nevadensis TaxID=136037 RepID=A0A067RM51_ZOONE|nr:hypothetical protein L798_04857 [Zootermopsis nevadensis]
MDVLVILVCISTVVTSQQAARMNHNSSCVKDLNCKAYSSCNKTKQCECDKGYFIDDQDNCTRCPGPNSQCESCCYPANRYKCVGDHIKTCVCWNNCNDSFVLGAQVALGSALTIALLALAALFWKTCPRRNGHSSSLLHERGSSLTSMQQFILQRLRDRPPRYEDNNQIRLEKPPSYRETVTNYEVTDIWSISPPLYSEIVNTTASSATTTEENNKSAQPENISTASGARTQMANERKLRVDITVSECTADNTVFTQHEARQTYPSETQLHM